MRSARFCKTILVGSLAFSALADRYVNINSATPTAPYTDWTSAATDIQTAVEVANSGETVWVTNGYYQLSSSVSTTNSIDVKSINGPSFTVVDGQWTCPCFCLGVANSERYPTNVISGFKVINGFNPSSGGGISVLYGSYAHIVVSNCVISANMSLGDGGGVASFYGNCDIYNCVVSNNIAWCAGGGLYCVNKVVNSTINGNESERGPGGGAYSVSTIAGCKIIGNTANSGGGLSGCSSIDTCLIVNNRACGGQSITANSGSWTGGGGGVEAGHLQNCTVCNNTDSGGSGCGGIYNCSAYNSIIYFNLPAEGAGSVSFSCEPDVLHDFQGNITNAPFFVDAASGDYRLTVDSPCIDAGINYYTNSLADLDRSPRIFNRRVDMGAYEFHTELTDSDGDGLSDFAESRYGTNPNKRDTDDDGFDDNWEIQYGGSPLVPDTTVRSYIENNRSAFGYYTADSVGDLAMGKMLIASSNSAVHVRFNLLTSADLVTWTNAGEIVEWTIPEHDKAFFRVRSSPE